MWCEAHENPIVSFCDKCLQSVCVSCCEHELKKFDKTHLLSQFKDKNFEIFLENLSHENELKIDEIDEKIKKLLIYKEKLIKKSKIVENFTQEISKVSENSKFEDLIYLENKINKFYHKKFSTISKLD